ncbi:Cystathionine gamma-synthase [Purpureocillium takamizusanense]|uniref:Cystathionine gamma-synthase n=1 Tax=Purpureocillium takamizusanense TaxID=2060973 RepID=A0A9Q8QEW4_9HYPO|nr:Cystathionine gamma-synthase [Purpureocillium takamizusanense]UNI18370.1 Cystathionine gamma-synthase [Purpureocillium takamizusanense]
MAANDHGLSTLPVEEAKKAAATMRQHIASLYSAEQVETTPEDVFLFQGGMSAITQVAVGLQGLAKERAKGQEQQQQQAYRVAAFGFLYLDTFKVLDRILGFGNVLYGQGSSEDLDVLEADLVSGQRIDALYVEFPGNPLLKSVDVERLHALATKYDFMLVVDDSIGTPANLVLAPFCDIVCSSLTKMYSGACNVMGGSVVHEDTYFPLDVLVMRANSAGFEERVAASNRNGASVAERLRKHRTVESVLYPLGSPTQPLYDRCKRPGAGYGFMMSVRFAEPEAAVAFHDALDVAKGPSFGTNFTLACPYVVLAHYLEMDWAGQFGVWEHLVRISVGIEDVEMVLAVIDRALDAADEKHGPAATANQVQQAG